MARYGIRSRGWIADDAEWSDGHVSGYDVEDGPALLDQPTGILDADGRMIFRLANSIGYLADN